MGIWDDTYDAESLAKYIRDNWKELSEESRDNLLCRLKEINKENFELRESNERIRAS